MTRKRILIRGLIGGGLAAIPCAVTWIPDHVQYAIGDWVRGVVQTYEPTIVGFGMILFCATLAICSGEDDDGHSDLRDPR